MGSSYTVGDRVWWAGEAWRITRIWDTRTEGLRADLESLERVQIPQSDSCGKTENLLKRISASVNVEGLEDRLVDDEGAS